jgi:hypothetical protein
MKRNILKNLFKLSWLLIAGMLMFFTSCKNDDDDNGPDITVLDGLYVTGSVTALPDLDVKGKMATARNEVLTEDRTQLLELYIPIKAGSAGISIKEVYGQKVTTYGPGADFASGTTKWENDEPSVAIQRGSYVESTTPFTVPEDGMYHVVIDTGLGKVAIIPVHWGLIGAATPNGWGGSTAMTESAFDLNTMTWTLADMELRGGDWKYRYSGGWKVDLDTILPWEGGKKGVKINTNFGKAVDDLEAGGANIVNSVPGIYTATLSYTLGTGYTATLTKTGDLPLTNWTGVQLDAVGSGISVDNPNATDDVSSWNWGNVILADNGAVPTKVGDVYTWTWTNVILEANEGFKIRTKDGVAPPTNGANFDVGYSAVDVAASSTKVVDNGGNLSVNAKGTFNMTIAIDAANSDVKKITITEVVK